jgi:hypothetical protein
VIFIAALAAEQDLPLDDRVVLSSASTNSCVMSRNVTIKIQIT